MSRYWVGCSGFYYRHWKEIFYPKGLPQKKWFDFYKDHFNTLELNVTFYRFPKPEFLDNWYQKSPETFKFSVKVPKAITHFKQFNDTQRMVDDFYGTVKEGLKQKLGAVLFQLPPRTAYTPEKLQKIIGNINPEFSNVLEFRNISWWNEEVYAKLAKNNISFCGMSHPDFPDDVITNTSTVYYYRFHGVPELYKSPYLISKLESFAEEIIASKIKMAYIYFNNDIGGLAITNAKQLNDILRKKQDQQKRPH